MLWDFVPTLLWSAKWLAEYLWLQMLTESTFRRPADILVPIARIQPQQFHVYFCPYSPLPACIFPTNLVDTSRQRGEAAACHWMQPSLLSACQVLALLPDLPLSWRAWKSVQIHQYHPTQESLNIILFLSHTRWQSDKMPWSFQPQETQGCSLWFQALVSLCPVRLSLDSSATGCV